MGISKESFFKFVRGYFPPKQKILDIGCGGGELVDLGIREGYEMLGIDVEFKNSPVKDSLLSAGLLRQIGFSDRENQMTQDIIWPIADGEIQFAFSRAVIEHVPDIDQFSRELARVLKPSGTSVHYFPSKNQLRECHTGVPLGAWVQNRYWYTLMCCLGFCYKRYRGFKGSQEALGYIQKFTFYRPMTEINAALSECGLITQDLSAQFLSACGGKLGQLIADNTILLAFFKFFRSRAILVSKRDRDIAGMDQ